jgi:hypothetical protein
MEYTKEKPTEPGRYDIRVMSGSTLFNERFNCPIRSEDLKYPNGYVHHSDNLRFRKVTK